MQRADLSAALRDADALLYPSRWEGLGLSLLEALHAGVPALVTDGWPMNEVVHTHSLSLSLSHTHTLLLTPNP